MISLRISQLFSRSSPASSLSACPKFISQDTAVSESKTGNFPPSIASSSDHSLLTQNKGIDGWQILAGVCVTRHPVLCPSMVPIEHTYSEHLKNLEVEKSVLNDYELKVIEDSARKMLGEKEMEELGEGEIQQQSALELLDAWKKEHEEYNSLDPIKYDPSPSSVGCSPSRQVVLVQQYKLGSQNLWLLPQGPWKPGENLRQTGERVVAENIDPALGVRIMGNSPIGFYKYKYPKEVRANGYIGAKVFFFRGCINMNVRNSIPTLLSPGNSGQMWLTHEQISEKLQRSYVKSISQFLIRDD